MLFHSCLKQNIVQFLFCLRTELQGARRMLCCFPLRKRHREQDEKFGARAEFHCGWCVCAEVAAGETNSSFKRGECFFCGQCLFVEAGDCCCCLVELLFACIKLLSAGAIFCNQWLRVVVATCHLSYNQNFNFAPFICFFRNVPVD